MTHVNQVRRSWRKVTELSQTLPAIGSQVVDRGKVSGIAETYGELIMVRHGTRRSIKLTQLEFDAVICSR